MKIVLIGKNGQVGWELQRTLSFVGDVIALGRDDLDLTSPDILQETISALKPGLIINAAAYTEVDLAETQEIPCLRPERVAQCERVGVTVPSTRLAAHIKSTVRHSEEGA